MTTRYRVEYALKTHRRDQFIEWIKGLLAVPFVLNSQPSAAYTSHEEETSHRLAMMASSAHQRYSDIFHDVELLIIDHIAQQHQIPGHQPPRSKLSMLVPTISSFFTPLSLVLAFQHQDAKRAISSRRFVPPSFNDIRLILNTSQTIPLMRPPPGHTGLRLVTFDGDLTLYEDGGSLSPTSPVIPYLLHFLCQDIKIGIVTAAGYLDASKYHARLSGLLDAIHSSATLTQSQKDNGLIVMGGESNFLFVFDQSSAHRLRYVHRREWILDEMRNWSESAIQRLLDVAESAFHDCIKTLHLDAKVLRKERAVGIYHDAATAPSTRTTSAPGMGLEGVKPSRLTREQLEETVLVVQQVLETYSSSSSSADGGVRIPWTAFTGGSDVFVDIGDKSLGVRACQAWFSRVEEGGSGAWGKKGVIGPANTLHVGDQFLSGGGNDFKARNACCTAWIAGVEETVGLLGDLVHFGRNERRDGE